MHLCVLFVFFFTASLSLSYKCNTECRSVSSIKLLLRDNGYYSCIVFFCSLPFFCLFVYFDFVNNLRAINLTFLARLFTCFETWSGIAGFMFRVLFCFYFGKNHCSHGVGLFLFCLFKTYTSNTQLTISFLGFVFFACFGVFWGCVTSRASSPFTYTHTELLGLLLQAL